MSYLFPAKTITFAAALRDLTAGSPKARAHAAHALGDVTDTTEKRRAVEALIAALEDDRPEVRAEAATSLGTLADASALPALVKRLDDGVPVIRQNAAIALGTIGNPDAFAPLAEALASGPADLRFQAATSLAEIDPARAFPALVPALDDRDPQVVAAAALSLGAIGDPKAIPALEAKLDHTDAGARFDIAYALADLNNGRGKPALLAALVDEERAWDAAAALTKLADAAALGEALVMKKVPAEATVLAAGGILILDPDGRYASAAKRVLLAALKARKIHVRALAVEQLGKARATWAKPEIMKVSNRELADGVAIALRRIAGEIVEEE